MSGRCRAIKILKKDIYRLYTLRPPDPDAKACEVQACAESKNFGGLKVKQQFDFYFLSSPLFSLFLLILFSFAGHLVVFILVGKVFWKAFRILELGERKCREVVKQDFTEIFISMLHGFLPFSLVSLTELSSFWNGLKDLFTLHKLADKVVFDLWNWWHHKR